MFGQVGQGLPSRGRRADATAARVDGPIARPDVGRTEAVGAGVAAADDDDVLVRRRDELGVGNPVALVAAVLQGQILHREVDAVQFSPRDLEVARGGRAAREHHGVISVAQVAHADVHAHVRARLKRDPPLPE